MRPQSVTFYAGAPVYWAYGAQRVWWDGEALCAAFPGTVDGESVNYVFPREADAVRFLEVLAAQRIPLDSVAATDVWVYAWEGDWVNAEAEAVRLAAEWAAVRQRLIERRR